MDWKTILSTVATWALNDGLKLVIAPILLVLSFRIINAVARRMQKNAERKQLDKTVSRTLIYLFRLGSRLVIILCLVGYVGIDTSGLAALVTSLGVCVGLAVNGALSNLAGGVMIIFTRPFKIDDFIEACGYSGTVEEIRITQTRLRTGDNKVVYLPNGKLSASEVITYSEKTERRVDLTFSVAYAVELERAKSIVLEVCREHGLVLGDPAPMARISGHGASGMELLTRVWVKSEHYWTVRFDLLESVKQAFDREGIEIPFPQMDVHVRNS